MKNIKRLGTFISLIFNSNSFSFFEMKDLYYDLDFIDAESSLLPILDREALLERTNMQGSSIFLYDINTCNILEIRNSGSGINWWRHRVPLFLNCKFNYKIEKISNDDFFSQANMRKINCTQLVCRKQKLIFSSDGSVIKDYPYTFTNIKLKRNFQNIDSWDGGSFCITKEFTSTSGVLIVNTSEGVLLSKDGKTKDMTTALRKYFVKTLDQETLVNSIAMSHSTTSGNGNSERELYQTFNLYHKNIDEDHYNQLQNSTILAIWCLIPKEKRYVDKEGNKITKEVESEMIGLAMDIKTEKLFHWTTDLGQDIEVLMRYPTAFTYSF